MSKVGERMVLTCGIPRCDVMDAQWQTRATWADIWLHAVLTALRPTDFRLAAAGVLLVEGLPSCAPTSQRRALEEEQHCESVAMEMASSSRCGAADDETRQDRLQAMVRACS